MDEAFPDNWTYVRTELNWLDRVLASAIARQRKDTKEIERVSKARIDQITSHWWKGLIQIEGAIASDSPAEMPRRNPGSTGTYQQRIETRIQATQQQGIVLGLPSLCQRLELSTFEKNLLLLALAPEISRRYGRIYNFLQDTDYPGASGLPTIDLILRLLCRNDGEWRSARLALTPQAKLLQHEIVVLPQLAAESFLSHPVKLAAAIAEYLLADTPQITTLDSLLQLPVQPDLVVGGSSIALPVADNLASVTPANSVQPLSAIVQLPPPAEDLWPKLVFPKKLVMTLQHFCDRIRYADQVNAQWRLPQHQTELKEGTIALLMGAAGTGKTFAAQAIAQALDVPLALVDLSSMELSLSNQVLQQITEDAPTVLLLKAASYWFGRSAPVESCKLRQFLHQRQQRQTITLLSTDPSHPIKPSWYEWLIKLNIPFPTQADRLTLWQQAFPPEVPLAADLDWQKLAQFRLSGGQIQAIARTAVTLAIANEAAKKQRAERPTSRAAKTLEMDHILQAWQLFKY